MNNRHSTYNTVIGCCMRHRSLSPHRLRMSVSYSEAGMNVPAFGRFRILLRSRRPHKPSSRPPGRPSPGEIEAGGHGSGRSKRTVRLVSIKKPRTVESTQNPIPAMRRFWAQAHTRVLAYPLAKDRPNRFHLRFNLPA